MSYDDTSTLCAKVSRKKKDETTNSKCVLHRATVSCAFDVSRCDGAMLEPGPLVLGCDRQVDLAAKEKVSIQR